MTVCVTVVCTVLVIAWVLHPSHTKTRQEIYMDKYEGKPDITKRPTFNIQTLRNLE